MCVALLTPLVAAGEPGLGAGSRAKVRPRPLTFITVTTESHPGTQQCLPSEAWIPHACMLSRLLQHSVVFDKPCLELGLAIDIQQHNPAPDNPSQPTTQQYTLRASQHPQLPM